MKNFLILILSLLFKVSCSLDFNLGNFKKGKNSEVVGRIRDGTKLDFC